MTETLVVRLDRKELAGIDAAARKRSVSRSAYVRGLLRRELNAEPKKGVGWPARLKELQAKAREIKGHPEDEIRELDRNRWR